MRASFAASPAGILTGGGRFIKAGYPLPGHLAQAEKS
tara:strand:+ start:7692 stop:7802 length:111 start_codon:yes stop_codon:yes gene_type:complete